MSQKRKGKLADLIAVARGDAPGDLLLRGGRIVEVFSGKIIPADVLVFQGRIAGVGQYQKKAKKVINLKGKFVLPALLMAIFISKARF